MSNETATTWPHQDFIKDNNITLTELPQKTQDKIAKFSSLTEKEAMEAMDEQIYGQIDDYLEAKVAKEKAEKVKGKIADQKKKKAGLDVSTAATAKTPEQLAAEEAAKNGTEGGEKKTRSVFDTIYGRK